jgi:protein TonB
MQLGAVSQQVPDLPVVIEERDLLWAIPEANFGSALALDPPGLSRRTVTSLVMLSVLFHILLVVQVSRKGREAPVLREQQVMIEILRPPVPPPVVQPEPPKPEPQQPVVHKTETHRPEPRVVAKLEPITQSTKVSPANELPELPVGDDPALAMASGKGAGTVAAPPPPPAPTPAPVHVAAPPVVAAHEGANYLKNPRPAYPELAQRRGWEGEVLLRVRVSPEGRPVTISVQKSSGRDLLDTAAIEAVRGWSFVPAHLGAQPTAGWVTVPIVFHLQ